MYFRGGLVMKIHINKLNNQEKKELEKKLIENIKNDIIIDFDLVEKMENLKKFYKITKQFEKMKKMEKEIENTIDLIFEEV